MKLSFNGNWNASSYGSILVSGEKPSNGSTDDAVKDILMRGGSYQALNQNNKANDSFASLDIDLHDEVLDKGTAMAKLRRKHKILALLILLVGFSMMVGFFTFFNARDDGTTSTADGGRAKSKVPFPFSGNDNAKRPLSTLHPVYDLGVSPFSRPEDSRPSEALLSSLNKDSSSPNSKPSVFPTNAWYQNMLLVEGEPTEVNRAYATPFLVDTVGSVPGLRVLPNHIDASSSVVQLTAVNKYGLTVGAAPDAVTASKSTMAGTATDNNDANKTNSTNTTTSTTHSNFSKKYSVERMTPLGLTLSWENHSFPMTSSIVKGQPYGTMKYDAMTKKQMMAVKHSSKSPTPSNEDDGTTTPWYPTVASEIPLIRDPIVDGGKTKLACGGGGGQSQRTSNHSSYHSNVVKVEREIELHFADSDFTWLVFVSRPVTVQCVSAGVQDNSNSGNSTGSNSTSNSTNVGGGGGGGGMQLQVIGDADTTHPHDDVSSADEPFFIRIAVAKVCTSNSNPIYCHHEQMLPGSLNLGQGQYGDLLRNHSHLMPGPNTNFDYAVDETKQEIRIVFDWDVKDMRNYNNVSQPSSGKDSSSSLDETKDLIVYALPHHLDLMGTRYAPGYLKFCSSTLIGPACLLSGSKWNMVERLPQIDFRAPRPPAPWAIKALAQSAREDIRYTLPRFYRQGAGDTYFSGKMLAKLGRVLTIVEELKELCSQGTTKGGDLSVEYEEACRGVKLPTDRHVNKAVANLRSSVEVWLNGKAVTPFVYDDAWGGVVSCGCNNPDGGNCRNKYPDCPSFTDPGLNFGNAFYNDLHFHYGYHIYAAAVVAKFDPKWAKQFFERVLLLIRNIANPAYDNDYFPAFRHKDWYQGHSWASGVVPPYLNGRNQESSSESIAAYEAVALYGAVMTSVWEKEELSDANLQAAKDVKESGLVLTATELRSTRRYYHVRDQDKNANQALKIYPREYNNHAIGMMWNTMAQYQTWFGGKPYLAAGIQLLPITPIAEQRDGVQWLVEMYPSFNKTCAADKECEENGWSVLQLASLATIGHQKEAAKDAEALSSSVFTSAGGNGHSRTNTLWYIATRPIVDELVRIGNATTKEENRTTTKNHDAHVLTDCYKPKVCTDYVLDTIADEYSCRQRMTDLMYTKGHTQKEACFTVAKIQFPNQCGACIPNGTAHNETGYYKAQCPPCTVDECKSALFNRCPEYRQTFVCTDGSNIGGCSRFPWDVRSSQCNRCCELTECAQKPNL